MNTKNLTQKLYDTETKKESEDIAWELSDKYHKLMIEAQENTVDIDIHLEGIECDKNLKEHRRTFDIEHGYFNLWIAVGRFERCQRRSRKMYADLYSAMEEAKKLGLTII